MSMPEGATANGGKTMLKAICIASIVTGAFSFAFYLNIYLKSFSTSEGLLAIYMYMNIANYALETMLGIAGLVITRNHLRAVFLIISGIVLFTLNLSFFTMAGSGSAAYQGNLQGFVLPVFYIISGVIYRKLMHQDSNKPFNGGKVFVWTTCIISILFGAYLLLFHLRTFSSFVLRMINQRLAPDETISVTLFFISVTCYALEVIFGIVGLAISWKTTKAGYFITTGAILCALNLAVIILGRYYLYISYMAFWSSLMGFVLPAFYIIAGFISKKLKNA